ncbi:DDE-type integrase/transposase/recombinase, partial [Thiolapillus sp.]
RDEFTDKSHRPHRLQTKLSEHQEMLVVELRKLLLLPLDDLLVIVREFIHPEATRSGIHRTLRRHGVSHLNALLRAENEEEAQPAKRKTFKDYAPGFVHVDVKYLPQMADESRRTYLFVAIDRATRWVYLEILPDKSARSAKGFLKQLIKKAPFIITRVLTDNGKEFTDRFIAN